MKYNPEFVENIYLKSLCSGCTVCAGICPQNAIQYKIDGKGFFKPVINPEKCSGCGLCEKICPGRQYYVKAYSKRGRIYYPVYKNDRDKVYDREEYYLCCSTSHDIRYNAASGGAVTEILRYLIQNKIVQKCYVVPQIKLEKEKINKGILTDSIEEICSARGSKYIPVDMSEAVREVLDKNIKAAIAVLPCQAAAIKHIPGYRRDLFILICLMCNHVPSIKASEYVAQGAYKCYKKIAIDYRGRGWPGKITLSDLQNMDMKKRNRRRVKEFDFIEEWGKGLGTLYYSRRCRVCNDSLGAYADIVAGDPYFVNPECTGDGLSFLIVRNKFFSDIIKRMTESGVIMTRTVKDEEKQNVQFLNLYKRMMEDVPNNLYLDKKMHHIEGAEDWMRTYVPRWSLRRKISAIKSNVLSFLLESNSILRLIYWKHSHKRES